MELPIIYSPYFQGFTGLSGASYTEIEPFYPYADIIRRVERASIRCFMEKQREHLTGRVLDFGCGTSPYRDLVTGEYTGVDQGDEIPDGPFDTIICNQVVQYLSDVYSYLNMLQCCLRPGGILLLTYPTNWDVVEDTDLHRFTPTGMQQILALAGFHVESQTLRAAVRVANFSFQLGYGAVCRKVR